jgi:predicted ATPase
MKRRIVCTSSPFIGRRAELSELERAMDALLSGEGGMFVLEGEPGIGNTRLAREFANATCSGGMRVLWGVCSREADDTPPLWPWIHMAHQLSREINFWELVSGTGANATPPNGVILRPARILTKANGESSTDIEQIAEATLRMLSDRARYEPLAIIFEDAEQADLPSLQLLSAVGRELRQVLIILTCKTSSSTLASWQLCRVDLRKPRHIS